MRAGRLVLLAGLAAVAAAAGGCAVADTGAFPRLQEEVVALRREVAALKAAPPAPAPAPAPAPRAGGDDVSALQQRIADVQVDVDKLKSDVLAASSRADEAKLKLQKDISDLNTKTDEQGQAAAALKAKAAAVDDLSRRVAAVEEKVDKMGGAGRAGGAVPAPAPALPAQNLNSAEEMYDYGLGLIKRGDFRRGREVMEALVAKYPDHKLIPNALYWKGESLYGEKDYDGSILAFQDVIDRYPSSDKAPDAMYKQGLAFLSLSDAKNARLVFDLVQSKYPKSPAAALAKKKASELK